MKSSIAFSTALFAILGLMPTVRAHGHLFSLAIDGTVYPGPDVDTPLPGGSAIRMISEVEPVTDVTSDNLSCGQNAANETALLTATVKPGSTMTLTWVSGANTSWPHDMGPLMVYLADCNGNCSNFNSLDAEWVKIDEAGIDNSTGDWAQTTTLYAGKPWTFTFPTQVANGQYLMRHEIIALHNAMSQGGAEFYPVCAQLTVTGADSSAEALPTTNTVKFPGAYSATDPGILVNVYNPGLVYTFPGPPLAFGGDANAATGSTSSGNTTTSSGSSGSSGSGSSGSGSGSGTSGSGSGSTGASTSTNNSTSSSNNNGSGSGSGSYSSGGGSGNSTAPSAPVSTPSATTTTTSAAVPTSTDGSGGDGDDGEDCDGDDGDDGNNSSGSSNSTSTSGGASGGSGGSGMVTVIQYVTVTVQQDAVAGAATPTPSGMTSSRSYRGHHHSHSHSGSGSYSHTRSSSSDLPTATTTTDDGTAATVTTTSATDAAATTTAAPQRLRMRRTLMPRHHM